MPPFPALQGPTRQSFRELFATGGSTIIRGEKPHDAVLDFARSTVAGLSARPRRLECRFLYDPRGSVIFDLITKQPEYYLTRTEAAILSAHAGRIRDITGPVTIVELGSGSSVKTDFLLRAWLARAESVRYVPVDVSESALEWACSAITATHPAARVIGVSSDYSGIFPLLRELSPAMVLFLGSTIGNFLPGEMSAFITDLAAALLPGDFFLLGIDLVKEDTVIEAAYNDGAGVTRDFTRNLFLRMNRELGSAIDLSAVEHIACYSKRNEQVEIAARFARSQTVRVAQLGKDIEIGTGEMVQTEISRKFRLERIIPFLEKGGFAMVELFTDEREWFALLLLRRTASGVSGGRTS